MIFTRGLCIPWFRAHLVTLNDPGRLISVHLVHTSLVCGWAGVMLIYELAIYDSTDPIFHPLWRQGCFVTPFSIRLGVIRSLFGWSIDFGSSSFSFSYWTFESVLVSHIVLSGLLLLASFWHWSFWDLDLFIDSTTGRLVIDLPRILGIHLELSSLLCFCFGLLHITSYFGPGLWSSDSFGLLGSLRGSKPQFSWIGLTSYCYGVISSHHITAGLLGLILGVWHLSNRPAPLLYQLLVFGNIEGVLSSSLASVFGTAALTSFSMWFGSVVYPVELLGTSRYHWDNGYFYNDLSRRVFSSSDDLFIRLERSFDLVPDKLVVYDYIGSNPSKGGLFRSGPILKGDGLIQNWLGNPVFELGSLALSVRRMPSFFETFPVVLLDYSGSIRADIPFRRAESRYSLEQVHVKVRFQGGLFSCQQYSSVNLVKGYSRKSLLGSLLSFDSNSSLSEGVFRTSARGWYSFTHTTLTFIFVFGHFWHAGRSLYRRIWNGLVEVG
jgi:photosystem II CP47 chlorophyll apoprotein